MAVLLRHLPGTTKSPFFFFLTYKDNKLVINSLNGWNIKYIFYFKYFEQRTYQTESSIYWTDVCKWPQQHLQIKHAGCRTQRHHGPWTWLGRQEVRHLPGQHGKGGLVLGVKPWTIVEKKKVSLPFGECLVDLEAGRVLGMGRITI